METVFGVAKEKGVSEEEVGAVLLNVMMASAGSTRHRALEVFETRIEG